MPLNPKKHYRGGDEKLEGMKVSEAWGEIKESIIFWIWYGHYSHGHKATMSSHELYKNRWKWGREKEREKEEGKQRKKGKEIDKSKRVTRPKKKGSVMSQMRIIFAMLLRGEQDHSDVGCSSLYVFLLLVEEQCCFGLTGKI